MIELLIWVPVIALVFVAAGAGADLILNIWERVAGGS